MRKDKAILEIEAYANGKTTNYFTPPATIEATKENALQIGKESADGDNTALKKHVSRYIFPAPIVRMRFDVFRWRRALGEMEIPWYPQRVECQYMFNDTILWGHVEACWKRRKNLTILRDYRFATKAGVENEDLKANLFVNKPWFENFMSFALDAIGFGYSLISLGDIENDGFPKIEVIKRWNVSPDRLNVTAFTYAISGISFTKDPDVKLWNVYVPTTNEIGSSPCGYGLFYKVALPAIYLRNNIGFNMDYAENFGQPMRKGTTTKTEEAERAEFANALASMGSEAWILLDPTDDVELVESKSTGQGFKVYESIETRCEKAISKMILGHADAMDSIPGKLGAGNGEYSPTDQALRDTQTSDGRFITAIINDELLPRMREMGFDIPVDVYFEFKNDDEKEEIRQREDDSNTKTATLFKTIKEAGGKPDWKYFTKRTGIDVEEAPEPVPPPPTPPPGSGPGQKFKPALKEKLTNLYNPVNGN